MRGLRQEQWLRVAGGLSGKERGKGTCYQWKAKGQCSRGDQCSFQHERDDRAKPTPKTAPPSEPPTPRGKSALRKMSLRGRSQSGKSNRQPCKHSLKGTCTKFLCEYWDPPGCQFYKTKSGCKFGAECSFPHWKVEEQPNKKPKRCDDKVQLLLWTVYDSWFVYHRTLSRQILQRFLGRAQKYWNQFDEYDSRALRCVKQKRKRRSVAW